MSERKRRKRGLPPVEAIMTAGQRDQMEREKRAREAKIEWQRTQDLIRATRLASRQNLDIFNLPDDDPRSSFVGAPGIDESGHQATDSREAHIIGEGDDAYVDRMRPNYLAYVSDAAEGRYPRRLKRMTEREARDQLALWSPQLAEPVELCHYAAAMSIRALARRERLDHHVIASRIAAGLSCIVQWTGRPPTRGPLGTEAIVARVCARWEVAC